MEASPVRVRSVLVAALLLVAAAVAVSAADLPELRLPPDETYRGSEGSPGPVTFSHATHVPLADNRCVSCHPAAFSILGPTRHITHEEMNAGQKCGVCHDGTKAVGTQDDCAHCHQMEGGS